MSGQGAHSQNNGQFSHTVLSNTALHHGSFIGPSSSSAGQKQRSGSQKPNSAQQKQRLRSQSPLNQFPDNSGKLAQNSTVMGSKTSKGNGVTGGSSQLYSSGMVGLGDSGPSYSIGGANAHNLMQNNGKMSSQYGGGSGMQSAGAASSQTAYRGYSPSKPKWKANTIGMPQQNNLVGGSGSLNHHNQMISHVQGFSATSTSGGMALRNKNKH